MSTTTLQGKSFKERLSSLRHDMRTPIGHIIGYAEMIEEELDEDTANDCIHDLQAIQNAGQRLLALVDDHFNASRESSGEISFSDAQFQLRLQLNHISGYSEMLREEAIDRDLLGLVEDLDHIIGAQRRVLEFVEDLSPALFDEASKKSTKSIGASQKKKRGKPADHEAGAALKFAGSVIGAGGELLIVDDDPDNRLLLTRRLARSGYMTEAVESGEQALERLEKKRFDLILLDLMMPGLSGLETLERIRDSLRMRTIPVIMLSAADDMETMVQCILNGAEDYVFKPYNPVLLNARINACLEKVRLRQNVARQLRVFISSPGDVIPERRALKAVLGRLNEEFVGRVFLVPILWEEEPLLASDTFQAQIHPPHDTDIYIGVLWSRIGSPLPESILRPDGTRYDSGTAFEFEDALTGYQNNGKPEMLLYRKTAPPSMSLVDRDAVLDRLDQMDRLEAYIGSRLIGEDGSYVGAFHTFERPEQFEEMAETHLRKLVDGMVD